MQYIKKNNIISVVKGDSLSIPVKIMLGRFPFQTEYKLQENDILYFGLSDYNKSFDEALFKKTLTKDDYVEDELNFEITPLDTLDLVKGVYYYEIKLLTVKNDTPMIETIIPRTKFIIC